MVDYPNSKKARKVFLCLFVGDGGGGGTAGVGVPEGLQGDESVPGGEDAMVKFEKRRQRESRRERNGKQKVKGGREWILRKKEVRGARKNLSHFRPHRAPAPFKFQLYRRRGKEDVPHDSKYTGRKRRAIF